MKKNNPVSIFVFVTYLILSICILPLSLSNISKLYLYGLVIISIFISTIYDPVIRKNDLLILVLFFSVFFLFIFNSHYDRIYTTKAFIEVIFLYYLLNDLQELHANKIGITLGLYVIIPLLVLQYFLNNSNQDGRRAFLSLLDPNRSAYISFFLFVLSFYTRFYFGVGVSVVFNLGFGSRAYWLMLVIFLSVYCVKKMKLFGAFIQHILSTEKKRFVFVIILLLFSLIGIFIVSFSFVSKDVKISRGDLTNFEDDSNKMRFMSNIFAFTKILNDKNALLWGYGDSLRTEWNIDTKYGEKIETVDDVRIVQPHNTIINLIVKCGLFMGLFYLYFFSKMLSRVLCFSNIELLIAVFFNSMFIHHLFTGIYLYIFVFSMFLMQSNDRKLIKIDKKIP